MLQVECFREVLLVVVVVVDFKEGIYTASKLYYCCHNKVLVTLYGPRDDQGLGMSNYCFRSAH